jgi:hypothetical protein
MYASEDFLTKKALTEAVKKGAKIGVWQPGGLSTPPRDGTAIIEGPWYPRAHTWYAKVTLVGGHITKVV